MTDRLWNIVLIALVALSALGVISFITLVNTGLMGGMMSCGVGMAGGWLVWLLLIAVVAGAVISLSRRRPQH
jgi:amino acid transporter